jgi:multiple sugar transport system substrate-binding protein
MARQLQSKLHTLYQKLKKWYRWVLLFVLSLSIILTAWIVMAQQPVVLNTLVLAPDVKDLRAGMFQDFEKENPGIRINVIEGPNAANLIEDLYSSAFLLGESPYDLVLLDIVWTPKFAAAGWLLDLTDRVSPEELNAFTVQDIEGGRYKDRVYRIPVRADVGILYYREDLLRAADLKPPETFQDLIQASQTLQKQDKVDWGYVWQGRQYEGLSAMFVEVLEGYGGFWVNPDTQEVGLDRLEAIQAVEFLRSTIEKGISPPGVTTYIEEDTRRLFQSGQVAFLRNWPYVLPLANQDKSAIKGKVAIKPMVHAPGETSGACLGGWGFGISQNSSHKEEAWKAVQYFMSREAQKRFILGAGYVPSRKELFTDPDVVAKYPYFPKLLQIAQKAVLRPAIPQYAQASDILQRYLSAALSNRTSPAQAMKAAANETRTLLGRKS